MGRPGLTLHRKFKRLARVLDGTLPGWGAVVARGALELLWDAAYEAGDDYLGDSDDVETTAGWRGAPGALTQALLMAGGDDAPGFIEPCPDRPGRYRVHDLDDHAPDYVAKRRAREMDRRKKGVTLRELRAAAGAAGGKSAAARKANGVHLLANDQQTASICSENGANGATPAPAPSPSPDQKAISPSQARAHDPPTPAEGETPTLPAKFRPYTGLAFNSDWQSVLHKSPGDTTLWSSLAGRIEQAASLLSPPRDPHVYAKELMAALPLLIAHMPTIGWDAPPLKVYAFEKHFERLEDWVAGKKPKAADNRDRPRGSDGRRNGRPDPVANPAARRSASDVLDEQLPKHSAAPPPGYASAGKPRSP